MQQPICPIPNRINTFLEYYGYDKSKIALRIGISPIEFEDILTMRKVMTADVLFLLCMELGKTAEYLANFSICENA